MTSNEHAVNIKCVTKIQLLVVHASQEALDGPLPIPPLHWWPSSVCTMLLKSPKKPEFFRFSSSLPLAFLMLRGMENLVNSSFKVMNSQSVAIHMHLLK